VPAELGPTTALPAPWPDLPAAVPAALLELVQKAFANLTGLGLVSECLAIELGLNAKTQDATKSADSSVIDTIAAERMLEFPQQDAVDATTTTGPRQDEEIATERLREIVLGGRGTRGDMTDKIDTVDQESFNEMVPVSSLNNAINLST
jgi:hypothetical protein